jgi:serine/threonine protein phosphatase 1
MRRLLVCSDIHGEYDKFLNVLSDANYNEKKDQLILLGDYIDRGSHAKEVVELVMKLVKGGAIALKGNHEELFLKSFFSDDWREVWWKNGGDKTVASYRYDGRIMKEHAKWMEKNLRLFYETKEYIFVHAGLESEIKMEWQEEEVMLWQRSEEEIGLGKIVVHGHTPVKEVMYVNDRIFIDTAACTENGKLTLLELPSKKIYNA